MPDTIAQREQDVVDEFDLFEDWMGKYEHLIELGKTLPLIEEARKTEANKIRGCQAQVWLHAEMRDGLVHYTADSDALITKGLVALLVRVLGDQPPHAVAAADLGFLDRLGLKEHLSPTRKNGLGAMIKQMKHYALAHSETARN